jgi:hypothetical protein
MTDLPDESQVAYRPKDGKNESTFASLAWLADMCSHVPNSGEQMVRYYDYYSNVSRGRQKKADQDGFVPCISKPKEPSKEYRKTWAMLFQYICANVIHFYNNKSRLPKAVFRFHLRYASRSPRSQI